MVLVGNSRTPLTQKFLAGKDSFGKDVGTEMLISARKFVIYFGNEEAYVVYDGCLVFTSDQKFLVEEVGMRKSLGDFPRPRPGTGFSEIHVDYVIRRSLCCFGTNLLG